MEKYGKTEGWYEKTWKIGIENDYCRFYVVGRIYFAQDMYSTVGVHHGASPKKDPGTQGVHRRAKMFIGWLDAWFNLSQR